MTPLDVLRDGIDFYESVIKSGETYTETVMAVSTDGIDALAQVEALRHG